MKVSWPIIKQFIEAPPKVTGKGLAHALTMSVVEVEGYQDKAETLDKIIVGQVLLVKPHPNADKLRLARVDVGGKDVEVVCGGANLHEGMKVAFALPGARVRWHGQGDWIILENATIRGVESAGMICAAEELDLVDKHPVEHGIMDLTYLNEIKPGTPLAEALKIQDIILEIDNKSITHRPDLWGHLGIARELAALWGKEVKLTKIPKIKPEIDVPLIVRAEAKQALIRYCGVVMGNMVVGESPDWLRMKLESLGARSINNLVDVTNYVMFELGQPLHAFDLTKLDEAEIVVRFAKTGEALKTLDGVERKLDDQTLVIADRSKPLALAGIMGGKESEVTNSSTQVLLESATFEAIGIRKTSSRLGLRTEASARFEKALDPSLAEIALKRTVQLLLEICPGAKVLSPFVDVYPSQATKPGAIEVPYEWLWSRLGVQLEIDEVQKILERLGFAVKIKKEALYVTPPSWRGTRDINIREDIVEEIARIHGYDKIPIELPKFAIIPPLKDESQMMRWKIKELLVGGHFDETLTYSFVSDSALKNFGMAPEHCWSLRNPVDQTQALLRPTLLINLEQQLEANTNLGFESKIFELGRVFYKTEGIHPRGGDSLGKLPSQPYMLALVCALKGKNTHASFFEIKGMLEFLSDQLGWNLTFEARGGEVQVICSGTVAGKIMERNGTALAEINVDVLPVVKQTIEYRPVPKYPSVVRDISILLTEELSWQSIKNKLLGVSELLCSIELFDVYHGKNVESGRRSLAFRLTFRSSERTLRNEEVDEVVEHISKILHDNFNAEVRV